MASAAPFKVQPAVEQRLCSAGADYYVTVEMPSGRHLAVQTRRARSRAQQLLVEHMFGTEAMGTTAMESSEDGTTVVEIKRSSKTAGFLRNMVRRSRKAVGSRLLFVYTLSYSNELSREVDKLVCGAIKEDER